MQRIDAGWVVATVEDVHPLRDRAVELLPSPAGSILVPRPALPRRGELAVAERPSAPAPLDAPLVHDSGPSSRATCGPALRSLAYPGKPSASGRPTMRGGAGPLLPARSAPASRIEMPGSASSATRAFAFSTIA